MYHLSIFPIHMRPSSIMYVSIVRPIALLLTISLLASCVPTTDILRPPVSADFDVSHLYFIEDYLHRKLDTRNDTLICQVMRSAEGGNMQRVNIERAKALGFNSELAATLWLRVPSAHFASGDTLTIPYEQI